MGAVGAIECASVLCGCHIQNDWVEQWICIRFCVKLGNSSTETIQMIQKATTMGNWWLAALSPQGAQSYIMTHAEFFGKTSNHPGDSVPPPRPPAQIWCPVTKLKSPLKGKRFQTADKIQENTMGQLMALGELWGPKVPPLRGTEASLSYVQCFLSLVSSSTKVSSFHSTWLDTFWTDLVLLKSALLWFGDFFSPKTGHPFCKFQRTCPGKDNYIPTATWWQHV